MTEYRIKPLVWEEGLDSTHFARIMGQVYRVWRNNEKTWSGMHHSHMVVQKALTLEQAQAACQADLKAQMEKGLVPVEKVKCVDCAHITEGDSRIAGDPYCSKFSRVWSAALASEFCDNGRGGTRNNVFPSPY